MKTTWILFGFFLLYGVVVVLGFGTGIDSYFAMCLIVRDGVEDLPEWIEYHHRMGCSKFYIYDHNSTVPAINHIKDYVSSGLVKYTFSDFRRHQLPPQIAAYDQCLQLYGRRHKFMGFMDSDEFIVVTNQSQTIPDVLRNYEQYGGLSLNWMMFGSSGHAAKPPGGVIANYHRCFKHEHVKHIVNTEFVLRSSGNPHRFEFYPGYFSVDTNKTRVDGFFNLDFEAAFGVMYINHYNTKSLSEFIAKIQRGRGAMRNPQSYSMQYFDSIDALCVNECPALQMPRISQP